MHAIKPVIQLAKERALFRFSALASQMLQDASASIAQTMPIAKSAAEQKAISASRDFIATFGPTFLARLKTSYTGYVERGMQTMYRDLRKELQDVSIDTLALVDDDTIMRQIEVERRVLRLRDADQQSLGRLNLMIAQLHDEHSVRERENPFRPYLMARALHDVLCDMTSSPDVCTMLFDHMSGALALQLPEYFTAIRAVFEANGVQVRLLARPSVMSRQDREMLSSAQMNQSAFQNTVMPAAALPALDRILSLLQQKAPDSNGAGNLHAGMNNLVSSSPAENRAPLQDFVWKIFNQSAAARMPAAPRYGGDTTQPQVANVRSPLLDQLHLLQQSATDEGAPVNATSDLQSVLETEKLTELDRVTVDVVTMLFDFIAHDALIPAAYRAPILQLQLPFMKAALLSPDILRKTDHPARQVLDRMASVAIGQTTESAWGRDILAMMESTAADILRDFGEDTAVFNEALGHLNLKLAQRLSTAGEETVQAIAALDEAMQNPQQHEALVTQTVNALRERMSIMESDSRATEFIVKTWSRVLIHAIEDDEIDSKLRQQYRDVVPDLLWSVQSLDGGERSTLIKLLPSLVQRVRSGLKLLAMPEEEMQRVMDTLVAMHTEVLRAMQSGITVPSISLVALHQHFAKLQIGAAVPEEELAIHAPTVSPQRLQIILRKSGVPVDLHLDRDIGSLLNADIKWLAGMLPGTAIEYWNGESYRPAMLVWIDPQQSFYLFKPMVQDETMLLYSSIALIKGLREGSVGMIEHAPVFDRAIESLLQNADGASQASS
ncbi:MAG TPA: DUF1631 family protein [Oxalicibacterium sp.]|uniref:DUF1631 family protein n=1 Tax=Oxalicibacterium sp. TaxID=2766525 RepID=UPI002CC3F9DB|nr:DUF1631 family protein [Oxalicibacterium sp.]HWU98170.1 DUF1631 family protein [Oxalicibacterium sp.]